MIDKIKKNISKIDNSDKLFFAVLTFFPLGLILGNLIINLLFFLLSISFFLNFKSNKYYIKNNIIILLSFFFTSLLINLIFSLYPINSILRIIKIFFIMLFIIETLRIFQKYNERLLSNIFLVWSLLVIIVLLDCIFEILFGFNSLGFSAQMPGRIASFFGDELVVGAFIHAFSLFFISYLIIKNSNNYIISLAILGIIIVSFLIGERSNFIKLFISIIIFSIFAFRVNIFHKILTFFILIGLILGVLNFNEEYKYRYYGQIQNLYKENGLIYYYKNSQYGAHQNTAIKIFKEYPLFGVGVKNFRHESIKDKYKNLKIGVNHAKQSTHPHQVHLEFLSETGIFGYLSFIIFIFLSLVIGIKSFRKNKNIFQLAGIVFILTSLMPILPSGSFLSTFNGSIFWINFSIMMGYCKISKSKL